MTVDVSQFDYSPAVMRRFMSPSHGGVMTDQSNIVSAAAGSRQHGASIRLWVKVEHGQVVQVRFHAYGCPHFIAAAEMLAEWYEGRPVTELSNWSWQAVGQSLQVPISKHGRLLVLETALNAVINVLRTTQAGLG